MALPLLDAMVPAATALAKTAARPATRLGFVYIPNGVDPGAVRAGGDRRRGSRCRPTLGPLAPVQDRLLVLSGLAHRQADSFGDGNGDHHRGRPRRG